MSVCVCVYRFIKGSQRNGFLEGDIQQRPDESEGANHQDIGVRVLQAEDSKSKGPVAGMPGPSDDSQKIQCVWRGQSEGLLSDMGDVGFSWRQWQAREEF